MHSLSAGDDREEVRRDLGMSLRSLRSERGIGVGELARRAGMSASKISRIELGRVAATDVTVRKLCSVLRLDDTITQELLLHVRQLENRRDPRAEIADRFQRWIAENAATSEFRVCAMGVPALLQSPAMIASVASLPARLGLEWASPEELHFVRMQCQAHLWNSSKSYFILMHEQRLHQSYFDDAESMRGFLAHIRMIAKLPNVDLRFIPDDPWLMAMAMFSFTLLDNRTVNVDLLNDELVLTRPSDVLQYRRHFDELYDGAHSGDETLRVIDEAMANCVDGIDLRSRESTKSLS